MKTIELTDLQRIRLICASEQKANSYRVQSEGVDVERQQASCLSLAEEWDEISALLQVKK